MICNAERPVRAFPYRLVSLGAVGDVQLERRDSVSRCPPGVLWRESGGSCTAASPAAVLAVGPPQALHAVGGDESRGGLASDVLQSRV